MPGRVFPLLSLFIRILIYISILILLFVADIAYFPFLLIVYLAVLSWELRSSVTKGTGSTGMRFFSYLVAFVMLIIEEAKYGFLNKMLTKLDAFPLLQVLLPAFSIYFFFLIWEVYSSTRHGKGCISVGNRALLFSVLVASSWCIVPVLGHPYKPSKEVFWMMMKGTTAIITLMGAFGWVVGIISWKAIGGGSTVRDRMAGIGALLFAMSTFWGLLYLLFVFGRG